MRYGSIKICDTANGPGLRTSVFVSGCRRRCPGCFNQEAQDFEYGELLTWETIKYIQSTLTDNIDGLSVLGGEPFEPENIFSLYPLIKMVNISGCHTIWMYTGFTWEELITRKDPHTEAVLDIIDVLVDGPYIEAERDISLSFRGSRNQRIINVQKSLRAGKVVLEEKWI